MGAEDFNPAGQEEIPRDEQLMKDQANQQALVENQAENDAAKQTAGTSIEVTTESSEPQVDSGHSQPSEDTRWDIDKAETVGKAAKESDSTLNFYDDERPFDIRAFDNERLNKVRAGYSLPADEVMRRVEGFLNHPGAFRDLFNLEDRLDAGELNKSEMNNLDLLREAIADSEQYVGYEYHGELLRDSAIQKIIAPLEKLYDANMEHVSRMSGEEFLAISQELGDISGSLELSYQAVTELGRLLEKIDQGIRNRVMLNLGEAKENGEILLGDVRYALAAAKLLSIDKRTDDINEGHRKKADIDIFKRFRAVCEGDGFNKTQRQVMEGYRKITLELADQVKAKLDETVKRKQEFMAKYAKQPEGEQNG